MYQFALKNISSNVLSVDLEQVDGQGVQPLRGVNPSIFSTDPLPNP